MSVDISPDGSTVVFDLLGDIYTVPIGGGAATRISDGMAWDAMPAYSPDGARRSSSCPIVAARRTCGP